MIARSLFRNTIEALFARLKQENVRFCVLKNYQKLPHTNIGADVDILVDMEEEQSFYAILKKICDKYQLILFQIIDAGPAEKLYRLYKKENGKNGLCLQIDVRYGFDYYGFIYLTSNRVLHQRQLFRNFYIPSSVHESFMYWLPIFLYGGTVKERYESFIMKTARTKKAEYLIQLSSIIGKKLSHKIYSLILKGDWRNLIKHRLTMRFAVILAALCKKPIDSLLNFVKLVLKSLKYGVSPIGCLAVFLGPDGSGKTTIAENVIARLNKPLRLDDQCLIHWRPSVIPQLNRLFQPFVPKIPIVNNDIKRPESKPSGFILSLFRLTYYSLDYLIGHFLVVMPKLYRGKLVIFDRYYYNFIVDPCRSKISLPMFIRRFFMSFVPKPDVVIYLANEPKTVFERKQELSIEEIERQMNDYRNLTLKLPNGHIVNGDRSVENVTSEAIDIILKKQARKATLHKQW